MQLSASGTKFIFSATPQFKYLEWKNPQWIQNSSHENDKLSKIVVASNILYMDAGCSCFTLSGHS